ncbi:MAG: PilZ domain-containing protein [Myxococcota bacterium]
MKSAPAAIADRHTRPPRMRERSSAGELIAPELTRARKSSGNGREVTRGAPGGQRSQAPRPLRRFKRAMASPPAKRRKLKPPMRIECARAGRRNHFFGYAADLSETGVFVQSLATRPPGTRLRLVLHLGRAGAEPICSEAEVRWVRRYGGKRAPSAGMGLRFVGMGPSDRQVLQSLCSAPTMRVSAEIAPALRVERRSTG